MEEQESVRDDAPLDPDGLDEPPEDHELRPEVIQPTPELRWTQQIIRGNRRRHDP
jgi:hypothetical protein